MPDAPPAVVLDGVAKIYRLYDSPSEQALDVFGLSRLRFWRKPKYHDRAALENVSLMVRRGERVGIIGRNGAGKTTLLKLITGNFSPTCGTVVVNGSVQALINIGLGLDDADSSVLRRGDLDRERQDNAARPGAHRNQCLREIHQ